MNKLGRSLKGAILILLIILFVQDAEASSGKPDYIQKVIKVGINESPYFAVKNQNGTYNGFLIDYLREIAKYAGWKLEYVDGSVDELLGKLNEGSIDLMGAMLKNNITSQFLDFPDYSSGYSYATLTALKDNGKYISGDYGSFSGMKVGIRNIKGNRTEQFNLFCKSNGINFEPVYYDDADKFEQALVNGEVDAIVSNDVNLKENEKILAKFNSTPYYFATSKGNAEVLRDLNFALNKILEVNPKYDDILYEQYFTSINRIVELNEREESYVKDMSAMKFALVSGMAPVEGYDEASGRGSGIALDVFEAISQKTGIKFEAVYVDDYEEANKLLADGKIDVITGYENSIAAEDSMDVVFTIPYLNTRSIMVKHKGKKLGAVMAVPKGYMYAEGHKKGKVVYFDSVEECLRAVISGEADYAVFNNLIVDRFEFLKRNQNITLTPLAEEAGGLCLGLRKPVDPLLLSIMDKAIYSFSEKEMDSIVYENTSEVKGEMSLQDILYAYPVESVMVTLLLSVILVITFFMILKVMRMRLKLARQTALRGESYRIIGELTKEYIFIYDFEAGEIMVTQEFSELINSDLVIAAEDIKCNGNPVLEKLLSMFGRKDLAGSLVLELQCMLPDGREEWFRAVATVLFGLDERPTRGIGKIINIEKEINERRNLEEIANTDFLTGIYNRQYFEKLVTQYCANADDRVCGSLWLIDLDYFKQVNDVLGHVAGDAVLCKLAKVLTDEFGEDDIAGRWGGDEFIVFSRMITTIEGAKEKAGKLCTIMNTPFEYEGKKHDLSISVGITLINKEITYKESFRCSDTALYIAKNNGRNGYYIKE